jgi:hypothetical protein
MSVHIGWLSSYHNMKYVNSKPLSVLVNRIHTRTTFLSVEICHDVSDQIMDAMIATDVHITHMALKFF